MGNNQSIEPDPTVLIPKIIENCLRINQSLDTLIDSTHLGQLNAGHLERFKKVHLGYSKFIAESQSFVSNVLEAIREIKWCADNNRDYNARLESLKTYFADYQNFINADEQQKMGNECMELYNDIQNCKEYQSSSTKNLIFICLCVGLGLGAVGCTVALILHALPAAIFAFSLEGFVSGTIFGAISNLLGSTIFGVLGFGSHAKLKKEMQNLTTLLNYYKDHKVAIETYIRKELGFGNFLNKEYMISQMDRLETNFGNVQKLVNANMNSKIEGYLKNM